MISLEGDTLPHDQDVVRVLSLRACYPDSMLSRSYAKWMIAWETSLTTRDTNRIVRPLEWGFDWLDPSVRAENATVSGPSARSASQEAGAGSLRRTRACNLSPLYLTCSHALLRKRRCKCAMVSRPLWRPAEVAAGHHRHATVERRRLLTQCTLYSL